MLVGYFSMHKCILMISPIYGLIWAHYIFRHIGYLRCKNVSRVWAVFLIRSINSTSAKHPLGDQVQNENKEKYKALYTVSSWKVAYKIIQYHYYESDILIKINRLLILIIIIYKVWGCFLKWYFWLKSSG